MTTESINHRNHFRVEEKVEPVVEEPQKEVVTPAKTKRKARYSK